MGRKHTGNRALGSFIRQRREALGISQRDLAQAIDASPAWIAKIELSHGAPSRSMATALAHALQVSPDEIYRLAGLLPAGEPIHLLPEEREVLEEWRMATPAFRRLARQVLREGRDNPLD